MGQACGKVKHTLCSQGITRRTCLEFPTDKPGSRRESVWDYPRPPCVEYLNKQIRVVVAGVAIADTERAKRVLETSQPPVYHIPVEDVRIEYLKRTSLTTWCDMS
jgi:uncharacterized protein (DUF427 family)